MFLGSLPRLCHLCPNFIIEPQVACIQRSNQTNYLAAAKATVVSAIVGFQPWRCVFQLVWSKLGTDGLNETAIHLGRLWHHAFNASQIWFYNGSL